MSIIAKCKYPAKAYDTEYGRRVNAVFTTPDGEELKIWGNVGQSSLESVVQGQSYQLELDAMGNGKVIRTQLSNGNGHQTNGQGNSHNGNSRSEEIKDYLGRLSKLMAYSIRVVRQELGGEMEPDIEQRYATTLFIQTCRKFGL